jgi:hypothetical protein
MNHYLIGASVTVTGTFTNHANGNPTDPTDARVDVVDPTGHLTTYTYQGTQVTKVSVGVYTYDIDTTGKVGRWQYRWWSPPGTSVQVAGANQFIIDAFPFSTP